jgi:hypothetical protein
MEPSRHAGLDGAAGRSATRSGLIAAGVLVAAVWLVYPVLHPVHVEGFSASIESLAIHLAQGRLAEYDALHPANLEFFALSRLGTVTFVASLISWLGVSSEWAMQLTMWVGFAALTWASVVLVRRWTGAPVTLVVLSLLLMPGVSESAFFFNDNVLSAALALGALAVVGGSAGLVSTVFAGLLFGAGIVARLDAVLLAPAVGLIGYRQHGLGRRFVLRGLAFTAAALLPVVLVPGAVGATILDVVRISNYALYLWNRPPSLAPHAREFAYFIGTPAALLVAFGLLRLTKEREMLRLALLAGVPLFFNLVALGKIMQSRQLLPLTPFFATLTIVGWQYLVANTEDLSRRRLRLVVVAVSALALFGPFARRQVSDGPRAPYGRFWSPLQWTRWQNAVDANLGEVQRLVAEVNPSPRTTMLTDTWDADRYLHLALQREGYRIADIAETQPACARIGELFVRGETQVMHLRLHQPFLPSWRSLAEQRFRRLALGCLAYSSPGSLFLIAPGGRAALLFQDSPSLRTRIDLPALAAAWAQTGYDRLLLLPLRSPDVTSLSESYAADARKYGERGSHDEEDLARAERLMRNQVWHTGDRR